jgi:hypothetical protein
MMVNNHGFIIHKTDHKKGRRHDYDKYKENHFLILKRVLNVFDLGYLDIEKDFPKQLSSIPNRKKKRMKPSLLEYSNEKGSIGIVI